MKNALPGVSLRHPKVLRFSPSISRYIPEILRRDGWFYPKIFVVNFLCGFLLGAIVLQIIELQQNWHVLEASDQHKEVVAQEASYWRSIVAQYPDYKDAYVKLAAVEYRLGELVKAKVYVQKALLIDPNDTQARQLAEIVAH